MKVNFNINNTGGPGVFLERLKKALLESGNYFSNFDQSDVFLTLGNDNIKDYLSSKIKNKTLIWRTDGIYYEKFKYLSILINFIKNRRFYLLHNISNGIVFQSQYSLDLHKRFIMMPKKKYQIIPNGIDSSLWPLKANKKKDNEPLKLLISGQFRPHKRLHEAIKLTAYLNKHMCDTELTILGSGKDDYLFFCKQLTCKLNISNKVKWLGKVHHTELNIIYVNHHLYVFPSLIDNCPNTILEAKASGLPVLCSGTGGTKELLDNDGISVNEVLPNGFFRYNDFNTLPEIDLDNYSFGINKILSNWEMLSSNSIKNVKEKFNIKNVCQKYLTFIGSF